MAYFVVENDLVYKVEQIGSMVMKLFYCPLKKFSPLHDEITANAGSLVDIAFVMSVFDTNAQDYKPQKFGFGGTVEIRTEKTDDPSYANSVSFDNVNDDVIFPFQSDVRGRFRVVCIPYGDALGTGEIIVNVI
jgi:hypothetical protein